MTFCGLLDIAEAAFWQSFSKCITFTVISCNFWQCNYSVTVNIMLWLRYYLWFEFISCTAWFCHSWFIMKYESTAIDKLWMNRNPLQIATYLLLQLQSRFCWKVWKYKQHLIMISIGWLQGSFEMTLVPMWQNGKLTSAPASSTTHWPLRAWTKIQRLAESHQWQFLEMVTLTSLMVPRTMDGAVVIPVEKGSQHSSPLWH